MNLNDMRVYIAAPFFNEEQNRIVSTIENELSDNSIDFFSPRSFGNLRMIDESKRKEISKLIYHKNIEELERCNILFAVIDNFDPGVLFEIGYFTRKKDTVNSEQFVITFSPNGYGINIMLQGGANAHVCGECELYNFIKHIKYNMSIDDKIFSLHPVDFSTSV